jgi:hypothetical protein
MADEQPDERLSDGARSAEDRDASTAAGAG